MGSTRISITEAKAKLAELVSRAEAGEEIVITRNGNPVALLTALAGAPVTYGDLAGLKIDDDLSLPEDVLDSFTDSTRK